MALSFVLGTAGHVARFFWRRGLEFARMLNWGSPLPSSLAGSRCPGRPPDPRRPVGRLFDGEADVWGMASMVAAVITHNSIR